MFFICIKKRKALCIVDEVQTFGRTLEMFAFKYLKLEQEHSTANTVDAGVIIDTKNYQTSGVLAKGDIKKIELGIWFNLYSSKGFLLTLGKC